MELLVVSLGLAGLSYLIWLLWRQARGALATGAAWPCASCQHAKKLFDDGVMCTFGARETFKNPTHIANCMDHEPR